MLLFTDLDNTLIYSHRHATSDPVIWVETLNGRKQSYISERTYRFYISQEFFKPVPLTTRRLSQYSRLADSFAVFGWEDALICNGSILLRNGVEDREWTRESLELSQKDRKEYNMLSDLIRKIVPSEDIVSADPFLFYVKTDDADHIYDYLSSHADPEHISILRNSRKVYCIPRSLNKGMAAERYRARFGYDEYIAVGDSEFDVPVLSMADVCICPERIAGFISRGRKIVCSGMFSDQVCDRLEEIQNEFYRGITSD